MSFKSCAVKIALNNTPTCIILWIANIKLKGIAKLTDFKLDLDKQKFYVKLLLADEKEPIELMLEGFSVARSGESYKVLIRHVQSNRTWLQNVILRALLERELIIPDKYVNFVCELLKSEISD